MIWLTTISISFLSLPLLGTCIVLAARLENQGKAGIIGFLVAQVLLTAYGVLSGFINSALLAISPVLLELAGIGVQLVRIASLVLLAWGLHELGKTPSGQRGDSGSDFGDRSGLF